ncbi:MAG: glucose-6-phosphate isomerase [Acidobacteriia bacterium]|nr:glucose-6-phosphate isomerase [Terriglobia bacterium]
MNPSTLWERYKKYLNVNPAVDVWLDISRMNFSDDFFSGMENSVQEAFRKMDELEAGGIANLDEHRMVGHYWLRNPGLAPRIEIRQAIETTIHRIKDFANKVHSGQLINETGEPYSHLLVIGIGGSALGPQFVSRALSTSQDKLKVFFFDNTDPDGMDRVLSHIGDHLGQTLTVVISKSGGTKETRNGMLEVQTAFEHRGLLFEKHAVAVTGVDSELDRYAVAHHWLERFPMWDWVGGRTSEMSAVGLLPAALQGIPIDALLAGARAMDEVTRQNQTLANPASLLALMWHYAGEGRGAKDLVILPYKDRLELFSRYLQQLVMESLGKDRDLDGHEVHQGLSVYGNKGSTDQHAYVQQLRDGLNNYFIVFIEVLKDREGKSIEVEPGITSGDYLNGFLQGTRRALHDNGRESLTITIRDVSPESIGKLIALFERAVGLYASLIHINAYHQPGVEAGKKAAQAVIVIQNQIMSFLGKQPGAYFDVDSIARGIGAEGEIETVFKVLHHLAANPERGILSKAGENIFKTTYTLSKR